MPENKPELVKTNPKKLELYNKSVKSTPDWIILDDEGKPKVNIAILGKTVLAKHNCIIVENGDKEDYYEYNYNEGHWELRNIKSIRVLL